MQTDALEAFVRSDDFAKRVEDLRAEHSSKASPFLVGQIVNDIRALLNETGLANGTAAFVNQLETKFGRNKSYALKGKALTNYRKKQQAKYLNAMFEWHFYLAVSDLLQGRYEELDPIIGDQACEMRCPFVLDLAGKVQEFAQQYCQSQDNANLREWLVAVNATTSDADDDFRINRNILAEKLRAIPEGFKQFCKQLRENLIEVDGPTDEEFLGRNLVLGKKTTPPWKKFVLTTDTTADLHWIDLPETFRADWYLILCKSFTRNRDALIDQLGIDIDHQSDNCFFSYTRFEGKYQPLFGHDIDEGAIEIQELRKNLVNNSSKIFNGFKQYLAHASAGYMRYCARKLKDQFGENTRFAEAYRALMACDAFINQSGYHIGLLPVFDAFRVVLGHAATEGHPIVVNLTRLVVETTLDENGNSRNGYNCVGSWALYYEPDGNGGFRHVPAVSLPEGAAERPAIAVVAASIFNPARPVAQYPFMNATDPDDFLSEFLKCDIVHLLMWFALNHPVFPSSALIPTALGLPVATKKNQPVGVLGQPANADNKADMGRHYARQGLYVKELGLSAEIGTFDETSVYASPCGLFPVDSNDISSATEFDYYAQLTQDLGIEIESVKYAQMIGDRTDEIPWERTDNTLFFVATHMYVTTLETEENHIAIMNPTQCENLDRPLSRADVSRKRDVYRDHMILGDGDD
ncbi:MAG: hypothetical protein D6763_08570 [Alphaproteobacteria bacterium]|nr:MAG: hypothetical protein D6763_08570 [Alphaproteobacteria bacterium]